MIGFFIKSLIGSHLEKKGQQTGRLASTLFSLEVTGVMTSQRREL